jgi:hypothetical protein
MDGWIGKWRERRIHGRIDGWMDEEMDGGMDKLIHGRMDEWIKGWMGERMERAGYMDTWTVG